MSVKLICKPEFFQSRLSSLLGLSAKPFVEPGTTYFLCADLTEVPGLVSSQDPLSLTAMSGEGKVQILICKDNPVKTEPSYVPVGSSPIVPVVDTNTKERTTTSELLNVADCIKSENVCSVTSTSDRVIVKKEDKRLINPTISSTQAPAVRIPVYSSCSHTSGLPVSSSDAKHVLLEPMTSLDKLRPGASQQTGSSFNTSLPCPSLRHELKQAILQRRKDQGKTMIDLVKEETDRQMKLQSIQLTDEDMEKRLKRRESNNRAARKCREKRKFQEQLLSQEVMRLSNHKNKLNELVTTLEQQKSFLRLWASGENKIDDEESKEMIKSIMTSEIVVPEYPHKMDYIEDYANSIFISSSEYNSDDTRNGFELDSSQDTNDSYEDSAAVSYSDITGDKVDRVVGENAKELGEKDENIFKTIKSDCEDLKSNSESDSDVELIEIDKPLVIDID